MATNVVVFISWGKSITEGYRGQEIQAMNGKMVSFECENIFYEGVKV